MCTNSQNLPVYILLSENTLANPNTPSSYIHPTIQYQFKDDPPENLLPTTADEDIIILDETAAQQPTYTARSLSSKRAPTGFHVANAPGTSLSSVEGESGRAGDKLYILDSVGDIENRYDSWVDIHSLQYV